MGVQKRILEEKWWPGHDNYIAGIRHSSRTRENTIFDNDILYVSSTYETDQNNLNKLNFLHTINVENNSVFSFTELDLIVNNKNWSLGKNTNPQLVLNEEFSFKSAKNISLVNDKQEINLDISNNKNNYIE